MATPFEIIASPYTVYVGPSGEVVPVFPAAPAGNWAKLGTNGTRNYEEAGVTITHSKVTQALRTAGASGPVKIVLVEEDLKISLTLLDLTLEMYRRALNQVAVTVNAASKEFNLRMGPGDMAVLALLIRGVSPYNDTLIAQYEVPRVVATGNPAPVFHKNTPAGLLIEFTAVEDPAAASDAARFGRFIAATA